MSVFFRNKVDIRPVIICLSLMILVILVYYQVYSFEFISFDDDLYVSENSQVNTGITLEGISWAFSLYGKVYWHPITWLSHMLDCELLGLNSGMHHLMNLFFHMLNSLLLFAVLKTMTGSYWKSGFVAALFALHPVNVDSVAWIAERKNLLSTSFWMLTMLTYVWYTRKSTVYRYITMLCLFVLGLLSKPMLVTLPFVFILLDYWPLRRFHVEVHKESQKNAREVSERYQYRGVPFTRLILEKIPLVLLSLLSIVVSSLSIKLGTSTVKVVPMGLRVENAVVSYITYLWKMIWPANLTGYYPYPDVIPVWQVAGSVGILLAITLLAVMYIFRAPYFLVGWLWFLGTLVPVSGIMQAGLWPAMAERWAYVPFIGTFLIITWGVNDLVSEWRYRKSGLWGAVILILVILMPVTWRQVGYWKDSQTLFSHDIRVNPDNMLARSHLAKAYSTQGKIDDAILHYQLVLQRRPHDWMVLHNLGLAYNRLGDPESSMHYLSEAIRYKPDYIDAHFALGSFYAEQGDTEKAIEHLLYVISEDPEHAVACYKLGILFARKGDKNKAIEYFLSSLESNPNHAKTHYQLAVLLGEEERLDSAIFHYNKALSINPEYEDARNNLRMITDHKNRVEQVIDVLQGQLQNNTDNTIILQQLAAMYCQKADYDNALDCVERIIRIQPENADGYYNKACVHAKQGDIQESIHWLRKAFEQGFSDFELLRTDKDLDNIRTNECFEKIMQQDKMLGPGY